MPIFYRFDLFIFHPNFLGQNNVAQKTNFILMKSILLQVGKKSVPPQNIQHPPYSLYVTLAQIFDIDENVIQVNDNKDLELLGQDLIDITLEACRYIE